MKTKEDEKTFSSTPLVFGAGTGLVLGAITGPIGAAIGSIGGAIFGVWYDSTGRLVTSNKKKKIRKSKTFFHQH
ncbi:hypothetical protein LZD49_33440 [Dyadobacter sp. CY261]|uniref:hypothetical protein n=1 Tax=Dyadobacter sp. CY261 TaxID=2907203 RepID=UPI001F319467|nr:hypothetical protein [Dyadobacter sp. CY261]MCF0075431.1 hypothetical protein [Dyadobacter sp. CY261]